MLYRAKISHSGQMVARDRREAARHAQEEVFEQAGEGGRTYDVLSLEPVPEEDEWDEKVTGIYDMDVREDVTIHGLKKLGLAGDRTDSRYEYRAELDIVVEAGSIEEARELAAEGPPREVPAPKA